MILESVNPTILYSPAAIDPSNVEDSKVSEVARPRIEELSTLKAENEALKLQVRDLTWKLIEERAAKAEAEALEKRQGMIKIIPDNTRDLLDGGFSVNWDPETGEQVMSYRGMTLEEQVSIYIQFHQLEKLLSRVHSLCRIPSQYVPITRAAIEAQDGEMARSALPSSSIGETESQLPNPRCCTIS